MNLINILDLKNPLSPTFNNGPALKNVCIHIWQNVYLIIVSSNFNTHQLRCCNQTSKINRLDNDKIRFSVFFIISIKVGCPIFFLCWTDLYLYHPSLCNSKQGCFYGKIRPSMASLKTHWENFHFFAICSVLQKMAFKSFPYFSKESLGITVWAWAIKLTYKIGPSDLKSDHEIRFR